MEKLSVQCMWILYRRVLCNHPYLFWLFAVLLCLHHVTLLFDALYKKGKVLSNCDVMPNIATYSFTYKDIPITQKSKGIVALVLGLLLCSHFYLPKSLHEEDSW